MGLFKRLSRSQVWDLQPGQNITVFGKNAKFLGETDGVVEFQTDDGETDSTYAPISIQIGNEQRGDGMEYCSDCGGYYLPHTH